MTLPNKIVIAGTSGCGKTTLGNKLSALTGNKTIDLDDLYWLPNWVKRQDEEFVDLVQKEMSSHAWIICGNYSRIQKLTWTDADLIVWLDLSLTTCLWRTLKRSVKRWIAQEPCCNGNYETLRRLFGKDSILLWVWKTYPRRKRAYTDFFALSSNNRFIQLKNKKEVDNFLEQISHGENR